MCRCCVEIVDHLLLHCEKAHQLWSFVFQSFGFLCGFPRMVTGLLFGWWNWLGKHSSNIWNLVLLCLLWCLWKERNRQTFEYFIAPKIRCVLLLVDLYLTGLGLGDTHLVNLSLRSFVLSSFVTNFLSCFSCSIFISFLCNFVVCFVLFMHKVAL